MGHGLLNLSLIRCITASPSFQMHLTFLEAMRVTLVELNLRRVNKEMANFLNSLGRVSCSHPHSSLLPRLTCLSNTWVIKKTEDLIFCVKNQSSVLTTMGDKLFWSSKRNPDTSPGETECGRACIRKTMIHQKGLRRELTRI